MLCFLFFFTKNVSSIHRYPKTKHYVVYSASAIFNLLKNSRNLDMLFVPLVA